jgi:hypothetical protein
MMKTLMIPHQLVESPCSSSSKPKKNKKTQSQLLICLTSSPAVSQNPSPSRTHHLRCSKFSKKLSIHLEHQCSNSNKRCRSIHSELMCTNSILNRKSIWLNHKPVVLGWISCCSRCPSLPSRVRCSNNSARCSRSKKPLVWYKKLSSFKLQQ